MRILTLVLVLSVFGAVAYFGLGAVQPDLANSAPIADDGFLPAADAPDAESTAPKLKPSSDVVPAPPSFLTDWTSFRGGPALRGARTGEISANPKLLWVYDAQIEMVSTAAIVGDSVVVGSSDGVLALALDAPKKGKLLWKHPTEAAVQSSPSVRGGRVYFGDDYGKFWALDLKTGKKVWHFENEGGEIASSATFFDDKILFASYDAFLYALDLNGKLAWKHEVLGPVHATPSITRGHTFVAGCDEMLRALSLRDRTETGALPMSAYSQASPAVLGDKLFVGTFANQVLGVRWTEMPKPAPEDQAAPPTKSTKPPTSGATDNEASANPATPNVEAVEAGSGLDPVLWTYERKRRQFPFASSAALARLPHAGATESERWILVVGGRDKLVHGIDAGTGKELWTHPTRARIDGSPVIVGKHAIVGGGDGKIVALDIATGKPHWTFDSGSSFLSSPAVGQGRLVIASDEGLIHCFDLTVAK